jgi:hypothetical protein
VILPLQVFGPRFATGTYLAAARRTNNFATFNLKTPHFATCGKLGPGLHLAVGETKMVGRPQPGRGDGVDDISAGSGPFAPPELNTTNNERGLVRPGLRTELVRRE